MARSPVGSSSAIHFQRDCLDWLHRYCLDTFITAGIQGNIAIHSHYCFCLLPLPHQICCPATHSHLLNTSLIEDAANYIEIGLSGFNAYLQK